MIERDVSERNRPSSPETVPSKVKQLILSLIFNGLGIGYLTVFIVAYLPSTGFSSSSVGLLLGVFGLTLVAAGIPLGIISDRQGRKKPLLLSLFGLTPVLLIFALTTNLAYLLIGAIFLGVSEAASLTTWNAVIADLTTQENRDKAFSLSFIVNIVSIGIGTSFPFAFPLVQQSFGLTLASVHRDMMLFLSLVALVSPLYLGIILRNHVEIIAKEGLKDKRGGLQTLLKFSGINGLVGLGSGLFVPLIGTWFYLKFQVPDTYSGPLLTLAGLTIGLAVVISPRLARRYGQVKSIALVESISTIFILALAFTSSLVFAALFYVARSVFMNMANPISDSYLMGIIETEQRGLASAINSVIWRLPNSASTILGGFLLASGLYNLPFMVAAVFYALSISLFYSVFKSVKPRA